MRPLRRPRTVRNIVALLLVGLWVSALLAPGGLLPRLSDGRVAVPLPFLLAFFALLVAAALLRRRASPWPRLLSRLASAGAAALLVGALLAGVGVLLSTRVGSGGAVGTLAGAMVGGLPAVAALLLVLWTVQRARTKAPLEGRESGSTVQPGAEGATSGSPPVAPHAVPFLDILEHGLLVLLTVALFRVGGVLDQAFYMDASPLLPPLLALLGVRLAGRTLARVLQRRPVARLVAGLIGAAAVFAVVVGTLLDLPELVLALANSRLTHASVRALSAHLAQDWTVLKAVALAFLLTARGWFTVLEPLEGRAWTAHASRALRLALLAAVALMARHLLGGLAPSWSAADDAARILNAALVAVAVGIAAPYLAHLSHPLPQRLAGWAAASHSRNFALGASVGAYLALVRPALLPVFRYTLAIEWLIVAVAAWRLLAAVREEVGRTFGAGQRTASGEGNGVQAAPIPSGLVYRQWRRHRPVVRLLPDPALEAIDRSIVVFLEYSVKDGLEASLVTALESRGLAAERITEALRPLAAYRDRPAPRLAFRWEQRRRARLDRQARQQVLEQCLDALDQPTDATRGRTGPAQQGRNGHARPSGIVSNGKVVPVTLSGQEGAGITSVSG